MTDREFDMAAEMIVRGDRNGLKAIYDAYAKQLYTVIEGIVKNPHDAEDLTADLFMKLWDTASQYRSGNGHKRYLTVMARNIALDFLRKSRRQSFDIDDDEKEMTVADGQNVEEDVSAQMSFAQALSALNPRQRQIVDMHIGMQMTLKEISEALEMPMGTVAWNYRTAIEKLKKTYEEDSGYG